MEILASDPPVPDFWTPWTDLGAFLGLHVGSWASWAISAGSWSDFELILRRF